MNHEGTKTRRIDRLLAFLRVFVPSWFNFWTGTSDQPSQKEIPKIGNIEFDTLSNAVIGCAIEVHRELGPGILESVYEHCLSYELSAAGIEHRRQVELPIRYKHMKFDVGFRIDLLIEDRLIVELKTVEKLMPIHDAQLLTYMKLSGIGIGLLLNYNVPILKEGIKRRVL